MGLLFPSIKSTPPILSPIISLEIIVSVPKKTYLNLYFTISKKSNTKTLFSTSLRPITSLLPRIRILPYFYGKIKPIGIKYGL